MKLYYCKRQITDSDWCDYTNHFIILKGKDIAYAALEADMLLHNSFNGKADKIVTIEESYHDDEEGDVSEEVTLELIKVEMKHLKLLSIAADTTLRPTGRLGLVYENKPATTLFRWLKEYKILTNEEANQLIDYHKEQANERHRHIS
jgi:hypothetical protein